MRKRTALFPMVTIAAAVAVMTPGCAKPPPPEPIAPQPAPVTAPPPPSTQAANNSPDQDWNIFPDPTTGNIDIYHKGEYLGVINGSEPPEQDPPLPHKPLPGFNQ